jgi:formyl-CoA transferase/CoA:oxalate CoA-transferase
MAGVTGEASRRALEGVRVLDLSRTLAGPLCASMLGDLGADVVKIEEPSTGDEVRAWQPKWDGESTMFLACNRNKRSVTLNLKHPAGRDICLSLADRADVVIETFG